MQIRERLLQHVHRVRLISGEPLRKPGDSIAIAVIQRIKCRTIAAVQGVDKFGISCASDVANDLPMLNDPRDEQRYPKIN